MRWYVRHATAVACRHCLARRGVPPVVLTHRPDWPHQVCTRHGVWLDMHGTDLNALPEVLAAYRAYQRFCRRHGASHPKRIEEAKKIVIAWFAFPTLPRLRDYWHGRLRTIGLDPTDPTGTGQRPCIVTAPELLTVTRHLIAGFDPRKDPTGYVFTSALVRELGMRGRWELKVGDPLKAWVRDNDTWSWRVRDLSTDVDKLVTMF